MKLSKKEKKDVCFFSALAFPAGPAELTLPTLLQHLLPTATLSLLEGYN